MCNNRFFIWLCASTHSDNSILFSQVPVEAGMLEIRPAQEEDRGAAGVVLTRAFAGSDDGQSIGNITCIYDIILHLMLMTFPAVCLLYPAMQYPNIEQLQGNISLTDLFDFFGLCNLMYVI